VIGIIAIHKSLGYLLPMHNRQRISGVGASKRTSTVVTMTTVEVLLIAWGCDSEPTPSVEEVVAAGDIASCRTEADEATAELVEGTDGTVLALGHVAYPRGGHRRGLLRPRAQLRALLPAGQTPRGASASS
jgi:hypothetical protein